VEPGREPRALTEGAWEVRDAKLGRDRSRWIVTGSREHPSDDHLYSMPALGGELTRLTSRPGRNTGFLSPDGDRLAVVHSASLQLPDLFLQDPLPSSLETRITVSGTDNFFQHDWVEPEVVSFPHPDGKPVWAGLYKPRKPAPERPAVLHIHGGGYRQFSHRGYSVYGYGLHLGLLSYLVQSGYTVLDLDYRGSAGFGRDYRTDIYRSMGDKDVESAVAGAEYLVREHGIERSRIGIYGVSYGGFLTLMSQFRHPGVFAAGVANAAVTDWAHYQDLWTGRILNRPHEDPEAYRRSSPIYYADGLNDALLIVHGLIDDNVQFQDAARLIQKLIELEKSFEVMIYPTERHTIETEASRYDYNRRVVDFFEANLRSPRHAGVGRSGTRER
jgi:dipeptidyl aminopeptidase/acylaminoacyl peptidase